MHDLRMGSRKKEYFKYQKKGEKKRMKWRKTILEE